MKVTENNSRILPTDKAKIRNMANSIMLFCSNLDKYVGYQEDENYIIEWENMNALYIQTAYEEFSKLEANNIFFDVEPSGSGYFYGKRFVFYKA